MPQLFRVSETLELCRFLTAQIIQLSRSELISGLRFMIHAKLKNFASVIEMLNRQTRKLHATNKSIYIPIHVYTYTHKFVHILKYIICSSAGPALFIYISFRERMQRVWPGRQCIQFVDCFRGARTPTEKKPVGIAQTHRTAIATPTATKCQQGNGRWAIHRVA